MGSFGSDPCAAALPRLEKAWPGQQVHGAPVRVTGATILSSGGRSGGTSVLAETLLAGLGALAYCRHAVGHRRGSDPTAFAFNYALTYLTTMSTLVQNIVAPVGLGVAIDYALLIVTRWREERGNGQDNQAEVLRTAATAGSSVLFSGRTVAVSLAALALATVPFLRSIGLAGLLIPPINIAVSATLLPAVRDPRARPSCRMYVEGVYNLLLWSVLWPARRSAAASRPGARR